MALINKGDEVIVPAPYWVSYPEMVKLAEGTPVIVRAGIDQDFKITPAQLEAAITPKTRALILCSPSNPTGSVYSQEELKGLAEVLAKHERVIVIADEIYEHINYIGKHQSIAQFAEIKDRVVIVNGVSKAYAMTGWRIGFIAGPEWIVKGVNKLQGQYTSFVNRETEPMTVIGVVKDCAYKSPTAELPNTVFVNTDRMEWMHARCFVLFKYRPGTWDECRRRIEEMQRAELPDRKLFLYSEEECYNNYLKSEDALSSLLGFSSVVCILISIFGIYSLVTLACERRRKEIAIRKVNGATVRDILALFFREYALLLVVSSLIAFPAAWWAMKRWIENYNRQVEIGVLPFLLIFAGIAVCVAASIGHRIWKTANENPAEVIKSE